MRRCDCVGAAGANDGGRRPVFSGAKTLHSMNGHHVCRRCVMHMGAYNASVGCSGLGWGKVAIPVKLEQLSIFIKWTPILTKSAVFSVQ